MTLFPYDLVDDDLRPPKVEAVLRRMREEQQLRERFVERRRSAGEHELLRIDDSADTEASR